MRYQVSREDSGIRTDLDPEPGGLPAVFVLALVGEGGPDLVQTGAGTVGETLCIRWTRGQTATGPRGTAGPSLKV